MYQYIWDPETGGLLLTTEVSKFSKEPRPVYYKELDILGFDRYWKYPKDDYAPLMWAEANNYIYKGRTVARTKGGSLYTAPELILLDDPEPDGEMLQFVDIDGMVEKNRDILETLAQETIQKVYNTYLAYKSKVDVFYVAFSGGKDSVVALDIVQRALPHDEFLVLFGDTGMEFSDTYKTAHDVENWCVHNNIRFFTSKASRNPVDTWKDFGPPATVTRWCCSVHKTAPQIILLRDILGQNDFTGMAFVGVRADESIARSKYEYVSFGEKHKGQYSCNAILEWSSAEIFLYIYQEHLILNKTYIKGNRRAGCLVCPRAADRNDFMNHHCYEKESEKLIDIIRYAYQDTFPNKERLEQFIASGGWKARKNGRDLIMSVGYIEPSSSNGDTIIRVENPRTDWKEWIKTIGVLINDTSPYTIKFQNTFLEFELSEEGKKIEVRISAETVRHNPDFSKLMKNVFRKAASCIGCQECQADCPHGCLRFENGQVHISDACRHCSQCHKPEKGCLVYKSLEKQKGGVVMAGKSMSLNSYSHHAPKSEWLEQFFMLKNNFDEENSLGSQMYSFFKRFLRDAKLIDETGFSHTAEIIEKLGSESPVSWGILYTNLCYTPQVGWYAQNTEPGQEYSKKYLTNLMIDSGAKESWTNDIFGSLVRLSELPMGEIGFGKAVKEKNRAVAIVRSSWENPDPLVILYALYKFAEACGEYYQFRLSTLLDDDIERDGVSPTRIFGLSRETMIPILNGLTANYPDFISASFTLDLENITLRSDKTAQDVLELF